MKMNQANILQPCNFPQWNNKILMFSISAVPNTWETRMGASQLPTWWSESKKSKINFNVPGGKWDQAQ